jgi:hypothetical protein
MRRLIAAALLLLAPLSAAAQVSGINPTVNTLTLQPGSAPTSPVNGQMWSTSTGFYGYVNGATVGPFGTGGGSGTVTTLSVASANGLAGTVANPTTTPAITLSTTISGMLKGSGGALAAATAGTDYLTPTGSGASLTGLTWSQIGSTPTTLSGYGITNGLTTSLASADIIVGNGSGVAAPVAVSGDCTISNAGALTCTTTNGTAFAASATTNALNASNINAGTLGAGRLPAFTGDVTSPSGSSVNTIAANAVTLSKFQQGGANTIVGNATSSTANDTNLSIPSCSGASNALTWTSGTGFGCNTISGSGSGTVTSVGLALPSIFTVSGSPVTGSGTLTGTLATETANYGFFGPTTGSAAAPTFRAMVSADIPAGIVANSSLANSSTTVNGVACTLGSTCTATAAAGTLTGTTLNSTVTSSSLTSLGFLTALNVTGTVNLYGYSIVQLGEISMNNPLIYSGSGYSSAPSISSGFGTGASVTQNNGTAAFQINVGTGGSATSGVIGLPGAANGWNCFANDITTESSTVFMTKQTAGTTTTVTIKNFNDTGSAAAWAASDVLAVECMAY